MLREKLISVGMIAYFSTVLVINASQPIGVNATPSQQLFHSLNTNLNRYSEFYSAKKESALLEVVNANCIEKIDRYSKEINKLEREVSELKKDRADRIIKYKNDRINYEGSIAKLNVKISETENKGIVDLANQKQLHLNEINKLNAKMTAEQLQHKQEMADLKSSTDAHITQLTQKHNDEMNSLKQTNDQLMRDMVQKYEKKIFDLKNLAKKATLKNQAAIQSQPKVAIKKQHKSQGKTFGILESLLSEDRGV